MFERHKTKIISVLAAAGIALIAILAEATIGYLELFTDAETVEQVSEVVEQVSE
jgi:hypothetical protein